MCSRIAAPDHIFRRVLSDPPFVGGERNDARAPTPHDVEYHLDRGARCGSRIIARTHPGELIRKMSEG